MAGHGDYVPGSMNISEQKSTYNLFWALTKWGSVAIALLMVFLAFTRTNAADCTKAEVRAEQLNACGKMPQAAHEEAAPAGEPAAAPAPGGH